MLRRKLFILCFFDTSSEKRNAKSPRGFLGKASIRRFILNRRRYNKAVGGITKPQGNIGNRGKIKYIITDRVYYISDDLYFSDRLRELLKASLESPKASCTLFPQRVLFFAKKEIPKEQQSARWGKRIQKVLKDS